VSNEVPPKEKNVKYPMMPVFDLGIGRELGSLDSRLARVENDIQVLGAKIEKLDDKIDVVEARLSTKIEAGDAKLAEKIEAVNDRVNGCLVAINRLAAGHKFTQATLIGLWVAVIAGIILQLFIK
jgi:prolyl-tRNA synthetase